MVNKLKDKPRAEEKIRKVADELGICLMTDKELWEFTQKAEREYGRYKKNRK
jgi:hypothetical protein